MVRGLGRGVLMTSDVDALSVFVKIFLIAVRRFRRSVAARCVRVMREDVADDWLDAAPELVVDMACSCTVFEITVPRSTIANNENVTERDSVRNEERRFFVICLCEKGSVFLYILYNFFSIITTMHMPPCSLVYAAVETFFEHVVLALHNIGSICSVQRNMGQSQCFRSLHIIHDCC
jgi:hypothetical protein